jgi:hypothetical protein
LFWFALRRPRALARAKVGRGIDLAILVIALSGIGTAKTNPDALHISSWYPDKILPGLTLNDGLAFMGSDITEMAIPFILGRMIMTSSRETRRLLIAFAVSGMVYSLFIFVELKMSPQIHRWIYGYTVGASYFGQTVRWGGYRPIVFMPHPLGVAMFICNAVVASLVLLKSKERFKGFSFRWVSVYLFMTLVLCKCTAAIIYGVVAALAIRLIKPRTQVRAGVIIAAVIFLYPVLRSTDLFPTQAVLTASGWLGADRAGSMQFRFENEDLLLARASERPWFGWGGYGRNLIYHPISGNNMSIIDGQWIVIYGNRGAIAMVAFYFVLLAPVAVAMRRLRRIEGRQEQIQIAGLALMVTISTVDLIPNGLFLTYPFFLSGALLGSVRAQTAPVTYAASEPVPPPAPLPASV